MARALVASFNGTPYVRYNVDRPVGRAAPNDRPDVLLVQFLLRIATTGNIYWPAEQPAGAIHVTSATRAVALARPNAPDVSPDLPGPPGGVPIEIDGYCGDQTIGFIGFFQQEMRRRGQDRLQVDGRVVPWSGGTSTILLLNQVLSKSSWGGPRQWMLYNNHDFPREISDLLFFRNISP